MSLFTTKRFLPLFLTQFLGALNDNLLKNALIMLITYRLATGEGDNAQFLTIAAGAIFILPFFLFSATAGQLADKWDRARIARMVKVAEILIMVIGLVGFQFSSVPCLMTALFLMGVHSTFFGPIKYALLPQHLAENELMAGNAYVEGGTFLAILIGTIASGLIILRDGGAMEISVALVCVAVLGYITSRFIPNAPAPMPNLTLRWNIFAATWDILKQSAKHKSVFRCILGISWFWLVGATFLAQFPTFARDILHSDETVVTLMLTVFSVGIALGSVLCTKLLRGSLQSTYTPLAAIGISLFTWDMAHTASGIGMITEQALMGAESFLRAPSGIHLMIDLLLIAMCAGIYIVPLYAIMQHDSDVENRARVIAANNVVNALFMVASALLTMWMVGAGLTIPEIFLCIAGANLLVAMYICTLLPDALLRSLARIVLRVLYGAKIEGLEHYRAARAEGGRVLLVANHTSFLDAALIAAFMPEKITFAINTHIAQRWWMKPMLWLVDAFPLDPTNPMATKALIEAVKAGKPCMIFPEGRITVTGALMKIYEGPAMIAEKSGAALLPMRIEGAQFSTFSRLKGKVPQQWFPKISLTLLPPQRFTLPDDVKGRKRRQLAGRALYRVMAEMMFESSHYRKPLLGAVLDAAKIFGMGHVIAEDTERKPMRYGQLLLRVGALGHVCKRLLGRKEKRVGVLLPTAIPTLVSFFALHAIGRVPAMLNFTAGSAALRAACKTAEVKTVITSRRMVKALRLEPVLEALEEDGVRILYLEEITKKVGLGDKLAGIGLRYFPRAVWRMMADKVQPSGEACVLFTSGSEGLPKGVVLSHTNVQANRAQIAASIDFGPSDVVFNCLPMFHAFGLTAGTLLPLISGVKGVYYPSPLHYRIVPEMIYDTNATILFGTDTFLAGYAKQGHPYDLHSIRYIFAGAEKLKEETRRVYIEKFGLRVFEGYGSTECAPVISINTPMLNKAGSVGQVLPGIETRIETVPGIEEGGRLWVRGPNVMLGYMKADKPGLLQPLEDGWYDTGDIVREEDGYLFIQGRTKRFAKIAGEMVSLASVEAAVEMLWPEEQHVVVSLPDEKKGEQIVLLTTRKDADRAAISAHFKDKKLPELAVPRSILSVEAIPLLGTGKVDYVGARKMAEQSLTA